MKRTYYTILTMLIIFATMFFSEQISFANQINKEFVKATLNDTFNVFVEDKKVGSLQKENSFILSTEDHNDYYIQWDEQEILVPSEIFQIDEKLHTPVIDHSIPKETFVTSSELLTVLIDEKVVGTIEPNVNYSIIDETSEFYIIKLGQQQALISKTDKIVTLDSTSSTNLELDEDSKLTETQSAAEEELSLEENHEPLIVSEQQTEPKNESTVVESSSELSKGVNTNGIHSTVRIQNAREFNVGDRYFKVTEENLGVYDNSTGSLIKIGELVSGQTYPRVSDYGNWHQIKFGKGYGFVLKQSTKPVDSPVLNNLNKGNLNTSDNFNTRESVPVYDNSSGTLIQFATLKPNIDYPIVSEYGNWYRIDVAGRIGYVLKELTSRPFQPNDKYFEVLVDNLGIFDNSSGSLVQVGTLVKGQVYPRISDYGSWHRIRFGNGFGFVYEGDTKPAVSNLKNINNSYTPSNNFFISLKEIPVFDNTSGDLVKFSTLNSNSKYPIVGDFGNWHKIDVAGRIGYVLKADTKQAFRPTDKFFRVVEDNVKIFDNKTGSLIEVGGLVKGEVYVIHSDYGNWHQIRLGNSYGYVYKGSTSPDSGAMLKNINNSSKQSSLKLTTVNNTVVVDNSSGSLVTFATLDSNQTFSYIEPWGNWLKVDVAGRIGYIHKGNVQTSLIVSSPSLEVYTSFKQLSEYTQQNPITSLNFGDYVEILSENQYAAEIRTLDGSITGWVLKDYLVNNLYNHWWYVKEGRNLRSSYSSSSVSLGYIPGKTPVKVLDYNIGNDPDPGTVGWYKVRTEAGLEGWIWGNGVNGSNIIKYEKEKVDAIINDITIFTPLNTRSTITATQINQFVNYITKGDTSSYMHNMGDAYIEAQRITGVNAVYLVAHSALETNYGRSTIVKDKYNYFGIGAFDVCPKECSNTFDNKSKGIIDGATWIDTNYISREAYQQFTLDSMRNNSNRHQYATDKAWHVKITNIATTFINFIKSL